MVGSDIERVALQMNINVARATAKLNGIDPETWLADVLRRINDHPAARLAELLPWPVPPIGFIRSAVGFHVSPHISPRSCPGL
jgi:hypothetical protein